MIGAFGPDEEEETVTAIDAGETFTESPEFVVSVTGALTEYPPLLAKAWVNLFLVGSAGVDEEPSPQLTVALRISPGGMFWQARLAVTVAPICTPVGDADRVQELGSATVSETEAGVTLPLLDSVRSWIWPATVFTPAFS